jgi:hypothetical protein
LIVVFIAKVVVVVVVVVPLLYSVKALVENKSIE